MTQLRLSAPRIGRYRAPWWTSAFVAAISAIVNPDDYKGGCGREAAMWPLLNYSGQLLKYDMFFTIACVHKAYRLRAVRGFWLVAGECSD